MRRVIDVGKPGIKKGCVASGGEVFGDIGVGEGVCLCVLGCVGVGGCDGIVKRCGDDSSEDMVSEGCLIWVVLGTVMGQSDKTCVREGWVGVGWGGGRRETTGLHVGGPSVFGGDYQ